MTIPNTYALLFISFADQVLIKIMTQNEKSMATCILFISHVHSRNWMYMWNEWPRMKNQRLHASYSFGLRSSPVCFLLASVLPKTKPSIESFSLSYELFLFIYFFFVNFQPLDKSAGGDPFPIFWGEITEGFSQS